MGYSFHDRTAAKLAVEGIRDAGARRGGVVACILLENPTKRTALEAAC